MSQAPRYPPKNATRPPPPPAPPARKAEGTRIVDPMRLANDIVDDLFCLGADNEAHRLVIETLDKRNGGGWCRIAVRDIILKHVLGSMGK